MARQSDNADIQAGINIVSKALEAPIRQIVENAGVEGSIVVGKMLEKTGNFGFNAQNEKYVDLVEKGIIARPRSSALPCRMPLRWPRC